jgi:hypothetical protein
LKFCNRLFNRLFYFQNEISAALKIAYPFLIVIEQYGLDIKNAFAAGRSFELIFLLPHQVRNPLTNIDLAMDVLLVVVKNEEHKTYIEPI